MRITEEMKVWLFDLAHGNLDDAAILSGFIRYYVLFGLTVDHVVDNIVFRTCYGSEGAQAAKSSLLRVLQNVADQKLELFIVD